jgi:hypothetical protein
MPSYATVLFIVCSFVAKPTSRYRMLADQKEDNIQYVLYSYEGFWTQDTNSLLVRQTHRFSLSLRPRKAIEEDNIPIMIVVLSFNKPY